MWVLILLVDVSLYLISVLLIYLDTRSPCQIWFNSITQATIENWQKRIVTLCRKKSTLTSEERGGVSRIKNQHWIWGERGWWMRNARWMFANLDCKRKWRVNVRSEPARRKLCQNFYRHQYSKKLRRCVFSALIGYHNWAKVITIWRGSGANYRHLCPGARGEECPEAELASRDRAACGSPNGRHSVDTR